MSVVVFFCPVQTEAESEFVQALKSLEPACELKICRHLDDLITSFTPEFLNIAAVVLFAPTREILSETILLRDWLSDRRLLVLPDSAPDTLTLGHRLTPRFLTDIDSNPNNIVAVLRKMIKKFNAKVKLTEEKWNNQAKFPKVKAFGTTGGESV